VQGKGNNLRVVEEGKLAFVIITVTSQRLHNLTNDHSLETKGAGTAVTARITELVSCTYLQGLINFIESEGSMSYV
jgi:hypothetical protein